MPPLQEDPNRSQDIKHLLTDVALDSYEVSLAVADLRDYDNRIFGWNMDHLMYPASIPKIFVGYEVLTRVFNRDFQIDQKIEICYPNDVDSDMALFPGDARPLLRAGDSVTIDYLLDLMLSRSDNTASNALIDLVGRDMINKHVIERNGWQGSEVTRKFLPRDLEDSVFRNAPRTMSCARHIAEFFWYLPRGRSFIKTELMKYMGHFNRKHKQGLWLPGVYNHYCCKGGRHDSLLADGRTAHWLHDAGIVIGTHSQYVVVLLTLDKNNQSESSFPMQRFAQALFNYMESYSH